MPLPPVPVDSDETPNSVLQSTFYNQVERNDVRLEVLEKAGNLQTNDIIVQTVTNGDTTHVPSGDAVFDYVATELVALLTGSVTDGDTTHAPTSNAVFDALVALLTSSVTNGDTTHAPTSDAVFDAIAAATAGVPVVTAWIAVSFSNSWVDYGSGYQVAQYRKNGDVVELRGLIKNGTLGSSAFTLPVGFRPPATIEFGTSLSVSYIDINTTGTFVPTGGSNAQCNLDGIAFSITT